MKFPVPVPKFPDLRNVFPVNLRRELHEMLLRHSGFRLQKQLLREFAWRRVRSTRRPQPVRRSEKMSLILAEKPANGGLLRIIHQSPGSNFRHSQSEIAHSLRRTFEKLPFLGDCGRRPGSICTPWPSLQCNSPNSPPWPPTNWECRAHTAGSSSQRNCPVSISRV